MKTIVVSLSIGFATLFLGGADADKTDKTLVAWIAPADLTQRGGSALTIQSGDQFDGIVFGELQQGKWMAGSDFYKRTERIQDKYAPETADRKTMVQMAIVYKGNEILIYRNGESYASYQAKNIDLLSPENNIAVFGLRHIGAAGGFISGAIEDARIYSTALTMDEIKSLQPNKKSEIEPYAWWDFEGDKVKDHTGRFAHNRMKNGAKLMDGKLVLGQDSVLVAAVTEDDAEMATRAQGARAPATPYVEETPAMPKNVPANWLTYHLAHPGPGVGEPGDPNPAFFYKGRYHLHYIYKNNHGFAFAHVSSKDMVTWKWHPTVLVEPNTGHGMFSGTGFFTKDGRPAMIYHGQGADNNFITFAMDDQLNKWTKSVAVKPKTKSGQVAEIRMWDPDCWLNGDTYYAISGGGPPHVMKSSNLEQWEYLGLLLHDDMPDLGVNKNEDVSCPNMFKIGDKWMLLCISHGMGCRYYLGDFKDEKYLPEFHAMMNWRKWDFFAPESLLTPDGRRVMWAWCRLEGAQSAIQSLPRELDLPKDGVLRIKPLRELEKLRYDPRDEGDITVKSDSNHMLKTLSGDTLELSVTIKPASAKEYGVSVFCDNVGKGFPITVKPENKTLAMGEIAPPFELKKGEDLNLRIFLDKGMIEVFVNDRQAAVYMHPHTQENVGIALFSKGGDIAAKVKGWQIKSIYTGQGNAAGNSSLTELALTPPMGWNSWNAFEANIDEQKIRQIADAMVDSGMKDAGYTYLVIDDGWMAKSRDGNGNLVADPIKFPSGMKAVGDYLHSKGLKFGLYEDRGHLTCQGLPGSFRHEQADMNTFASWGVDYIKLDSCFAENNGRFSSEDYALYRKSITETGRPMVLSISDFGNGAWAWGGENMAQLWRTSGDIYPWMDSVYYSADTSGGDQSIHPAFNGLWQFAGPGRWNDPDMLQVGNLKDLDDNRKEIADRAHFSLWCILAAPLMAGNDLRSMSDAVRKVLTAPEVIAVNQDRRGIQGYRVLHEGGREVYSKPLADGTTAVLLLNKGRKVTDISVRWDRIGLSGNQPVRDLWARKNIGEFKDSFTAQGLGQHEHRMIKVGRPGPPLPTPATMPLEKYTVTHQGETYLSDLCYIWKADNAPAYDAALDGDPIRVGGRTFKKGIGCKGKCSVMFKVDGFADRFSAIVAIDESSKDDSKGRFRVYNGDFFSNRILWDSGQMRKDSPAREIDIEVKGVQCLMLVFEGDEVLGNWADARVISQSETD